MKVGKTFQNEYLNIFDPKSSLQCDILVLFIATIQTLVGAVI